MARHDGDRRTVGEHSARQRLDGRDAGAFDGGLHHEVLGLVAEDEHSR